MDWTQVASVLRRKDEQHAGNWGHEDTVMVLVWTALHYLPDSLVEKLGLPSGLNWRRGGNGQGDLVGYCGNDLKVHLEIKSPGAAVNLSERSGLYQFQTFEKDGCDIVVLTTTGTRTAKAAKWRDQCGLPSRASVVSFSEFADLVDAVASTLELDERRATEAMIVDSIFYLDLA